jgi:hypothetical protein
MVKEQWSSEKKKNEEQRLQDRQDQRDIEFEKLYKTPAFTPHLITTVMDTTTGKRVTSVTMKNGDVYFGDQDELVNIITKKATDIVDNLFNI